MKYVADLVREARGMGAIFRVDGKSVMVDSPSPLPSNLMDELRARKPEVREHLNARRGLLLNRLRSGSEWLIEVDARLLTRSAGKRRSEQEHQLHEGIAEWHRLEQELRSHYPHFTTCALGRGQPCPAGAPVRCSACDAATAEEPIVAGETQSTTA